MQKLWLSVGIVLILAVGISVYIQVQTTRARVMELMSSAPLYIS